MGLRVSFAGDVRPWSEAETLARKCRPWDRLFATFATLVSLAYYYRLLACSSRAVYFRSTPSCTACLAEFPLDAGAATGLLHTAARLPTLLRCTTPGEAWIAANALASTAWLLTAVLAPRYTPRTRELAFAAFAISGMLMQALTLAVRVQSPTSFFQHHSKLLWVLLLWLNACVPHRLRWTVVVNSVFAAIAVAIPLLDGLLPEAQRLAPPGSVVAGIAVVAAAVAGMAIAHRREARDRAGRRHLHLPSAASGIPSSLPSAVGSGGDHDGDGDGGGHRGKDRLAGAVADAAAVLNVAKPLPQGAGHESSTLAAAQRAWRLAASTPSLELTAVTTMATRVTTLAPRHHVSAAPLTSGRSVAELLSGFSLYTSPVARATVYVKLPGVEPDQVPAGLVGRLAGRAGAAGMHLHNVCVRAGCIELLVELTEPLRLARGNSAGGGGGADGAASVHMASAIVNALGVQLPAGAQICVHWGPQQLHLLQDAAGAWTMDAPARQAGQVGQVGVSHLPSSGGTPLPAGARLLAVRPLFLTVVPAAPASGAAAATLLLLPLSLQCQLSAPLLSAEALVVTQCGRFLRSQLVGQGSSGGSSGGSSSSTCLELQVFGADLTLPGLLRVELRGDSNGGGGGGAARGSSAVLILPNAAMALELGEVAEEVELLVAATAPDCLVIAQALRDLVVDLGAWFEFVAATQALARQDGGSSGSRAAGNGGGGGGFDVLALRPDLCALAAVAGQRELMCETAEGLLGYAAQRGWTNTEACLKEGVRKAGLDRPGGGVAAAPVPAPAGEASGSKGVGTAPDACTCARAWARCSGACARLASKRRSMDGRRSRREGDAAGRRCLPLLTCVSPVWHASLATPLCACGLLAACLLCACTASESGAGLRAVMVAWLA